MTTETRRSDRIAAYNAGHGQGEIVSKSGNSSDSPGPDERHARTEWEWHEGYHDALCGIYEPDRVG